LWFIPPSDFLGKLSQEDHAALLALAETRTFRRKAPVFQAGSPGNNVYILKHGRVKIFALSPLGRQVILWFCFPGEIFGLAEMPRGGQREVSAEACADSAVLAIPQQDFKSFLASHPDTAMRVIDLLSCRLRTLGDMLLNLTSDDVTTRVVKLLIRLSARYGRRLATEDVCLDIDLTHQDIADMIGTSRQTVTSVLSDLRRRGAVRVENHHIHIPSQRLLERLADNAPLAPSPLTDRASSL
jgi:CRP/FNR family transcriptional regulator